MADYAYVVSSIDDALSIFEVTDPATPPFVAGLRGARAPNFPGGAIRLFIKGVFAPTVTTLPATGVT